MSGRISALTIPKLGLTMKEGAVAAWHLAQGEAVSVGQPVFDVETEKVTNECVAESAGILRRQVAGRDDILVLLLVSHCETPSHERPTHRRTNYPANYPA